MWWKMIYDMEENKAEVVWRERVRENGVVEGDIWEGDI